MTDHANMDLDALAAALAPTGLAVHAGELLARHTTFRIGGPADLYVTVSKRAELARVAELAAAHHVPLTILGGGSNILVSDAGIRGIVVGNACRQIHQKESLVVADAGVALAGLARWTIRNGLSGLEWAVSIPGTVGGAVIGNAGAHGGDVAGVLAWATVAYPGQGQERLSAADLVYTYRSSRLKLKLAPAGPENEGCRRPVVLEAAFRLAPGEPERMTALADGYLSRRRASQPVEPSAGSIFRNPDGDYAGRLIEAAGLKGHQLGGARISPRHANFIINMGDAQAADVVGLIDLMRARVYAGFEISLTPEILFVGSWPQFPPYAALPTHETHRIIG